MQVSRMSCHSWSRSHPAPHGVKPSICEGSRLRQCRRRFASRAASRAASEDAATEAAAATQELPPMVELSKDNFWQYLKAEENKGVIITVDCYTDWCGPCKMIYPELVKMSAEMEPLARVVKFNCNKYNKELGVQLKIKVAPTFLLYKDGEKIGEMTGAKVQKLRNLINDRLAGGMNSLSSLSSAEQVPVSYTEP